MTTVDEMLQGLQAKFHHNNVVKRELDVMCA